MSTRGATSIFTEQFFEDLSPSYSLKTLLSLFFFFKYLIPLFFHWPCVQEHRKHIYS